MSDTDDGASSEGEGGTVDAGPDVGAVRRHVLSEHRALLERTVDLADAIAAAWDREVDGRPAIGDGDAVRGPLRGALERSGVLAELPTVLRECANVAGGELGADPVAAPPYVAVTSSGPMLRATLPDGRLVVRFEVFAVDGGNYVRTGTDPAAILDVESA